MADELEHDDDETFSDDEDGGGRGPSFKLGLLVGVIVGALGGRLFGPSMADQAASEMPFDTAEAAGTLRSAFAGVKERFQEASQEAVQAMRESEEASRARLDELIKKQP